MLVRSAGIAVSSDEVALIKALYNALDSFDKRLMLSSEAYSNLENDSVGTGKLSIHTQSLWPGAYFMH